MSHSLESLMREQLASEARPSLAGSLFAFIGIGGSAALTFTLVSAAAVTAVQSLPAWLVSSICYAAFIVPVYLLHRRYSFRSDAAHRQALPRYVAVQLGNLVLATCFSWIVYNALGLPALGAAFIVTLLTAGISFVVLRSWAFANP